MAESKDEGLESVLLKLMEIILEFCLQFNTTLLGNNSTTNMFIMDKNYSCFRSYMIVVL